MIGGEAVEVMVALLPELVWLGLLVACALMFVLWALSLRLRNAGVVDAGWALCLGFLGILYAAQGDAPLLRRVLVAGMTGVWSLRLTTHLVRDRIWGKAEEGRYQRLRNYWGTRANAWFLPFFIGQGLLASLLATPFYLAANDPRPAPAALDMGALALFVASLSMVWLSDTQLAHFKSEPSNRGKTCRVGLWRWSRHPNYFFEWLTWGAFALLALPAPQGAWGLVAPALMLVLILKVTGIPPTEAQALRSRGDDYRSYQETTSPFVPWPPKEELS